MSDGVEVKERPFPWPDDYWDLREWFNAPKMSNGYRDWEGFASGPHAYNLALQALTDNGMGKPEDSTVPFQMLLDIVANVIYETIDQAEEQSRQEYAAMAWGIATVLDTRRWLKSHKPPEFLPDGIVPEEDGGFIGEEEEESEKL